MERSHNLPIDELQRRAGSANRGFNDTIIKPQAFRIGLSQSNPEFLPPKKKVIIFPRQQNFAQINTQTATETLLLPATTSRIKSRRDRTASPVSELNDVVEAINTRVQKENQPLADDVSAETLMVQALQKILSSKSQAKAPTKLV
ncbi:MAG TPA: hypothetical protein VD999_07185 [Vitreimonas sp.]|nr:hypothetical protein [Vitreimonas sp.]